MTIPINVIFGHLQVSEWILAMSDTQRGKILLGSLGTAFEPIDSFSLTLLLSSHGCFFFSLSKKKTRVRIWLYEDTKTQLEGQIIGFDEYMNMVLDDAVEIGKKRTEVGRILLKGDAITLIQEAQPEKKEDDQAAPTN